MEQADKIKEAIFPYITKIFEYKEAEAKEIFNAFNVKKVDIKQTNSGIYANSSLATLGDAIVALLLCEELYATKTKGEITYQKSQMLNNGIFKKVSNDFELPLFCNDGENFAISLPQHKKLVNDASALLEAVIGALYIDLGLSRTREIWKKYFYPQIVKRTTESIQIVTDKDTDANGLSFSEQSIKENELYVCRFHRFKSGDANELKGQLWFNKSRERGFVGQGLLFYIDASIDAIKEYISQSKKVPNCAFVFKLDLKALPPAHCHEPELSCKTTFLKVDGCEHSHILMVDDTSREEDLHADIIPHIVLRFPVNAAASTDAYEKILYHCKKYGIPFLDM